MNAEARSHDVRVWRGWVEQGTREFDRAVSALDDRDLTGPSILPGWSRAHVVAHVARNADALNNLLLWARTGVETPMYVNDEQRDSEIRTTVLLSSDDLRSDLELAERRFADAIASHPAAAWLAEVRTRTGRTIPAAEVLWMRVREVWVHAVDLRSGASFDDFPPALVRAFLDELARTFTSRPDFSSMELVASDLEASWSVGPEDSDRCVVDGRSADILAWLLGRSAGQALTASTGARPEVPAWL